MKYRTDLILGEAFHFQDSGLSVLNVCIFIFDGVRVKKKKENSITAQRWNKAFTRILQGPERLAERA